MAKFDPFGRKAKREATLQANLARLALELEYDKAYERARAEARAALDVRREADMAHFAAEGQRVRLIEAEARAISAKQAALGALQATQARDLALSDELIAQIVQLAPLQGPGRRRDGTFTPIPAAKEAQIKLEQALVVVAERIGAAGRG